VLKTGRISLLLSTLRWVGLIFVCSMTVGVMPAAAAPPNVQGRWEFAITSGDTDWQLTNMGQSTFSTYLLQAGSSLRNIVSFTTDTVACDTVSNNNILVTYGAVDDSGHVVVTFTVTAADQTTFQYAFTGTYSDGHGTNPSVITGTYQKSADNCNQGTLGTASPGPDGNFTATFFPDLSGTWAGAFDPNEGTGPTSVPATFTLTTNADKTLSGTVSSPGLTDLSGTACLASTVNLQPLTEGVSYAAGVSMELFGTDTAGTKLWVIGWATNPNGSTAAVGEDTAPGTNDGTNNSYTAFYGISGGPCNGLGGGDDPFQLITKKNASKKDQVHGKDHQQLGRGHQR
jgi:hypothetical protein